MAEIYPVRFFHELMILKYRISRCQATLSSKLLPCLSRLPDFSTRAADCVISWYNEWKRRDFSLEFTSATFMDRATLKFRQLMCVELCASSKATLEFA
jgi:hypothetical protein